MHAWILVLMQLSLMVTAFAYVAPTNEALRGHPYTLREASLEYAWAFIYALPLVVLLAVPTAFLSRWVFGIRVARREHHSASTHNAWTYSIVASLVCFLPAFYMGFGNLIGYAGMLLYFLVAVFPNAVICYFLLDRSGGLSAKG